MNWSGWHIRPWSQARRTSACSKHTTATVFAHCIATTKRNHTFDACERLQRVLGDEHVGTRRAVEGLIALYDAWGKPDYAAEWRAKLPTTQPVQNEAEPASNGGSP